MAEIKTLTYSRTINLGNDESERLEATVELFPIPSGNRPSSDWDMEDSMKAFIQLREWVIARLYAHPSSPE